MLQVKVGEFGWKERYYSKNFEENIEEAQEQTKKDDISTMCWDLYAI